MRWRGEPILILGLAALLGAGCRKQTEIAPPPRPVSPLFAPSLTSRLEGLERDKWQKPGEIIRALRLKPGETVADVGAGSGYLERRLSQAVRPQGRVCAEEIQPAFMPPLRRRAKAMPNVRVILGTADDPRLPVQGVDCFVLLTVYHEVQQPTAFLQTLHRFARPGARLAIIDFDDTRHGMPPAPVNHWVAESDVLAEAKAAGWTLAERHEFLSSQFFLVFQSITSRR